MKATRQPWALFLGAWSIHATPIVVFFGRALWLGYLGWAG